MKRVLLFGANQHGVGGQLAHALWRVFGEESAISLHCYSRLEMDVRDHVRLQHVISSFRPHVVLNATAMTDVDGCERSPDLATYINGHAVSHMADLCKRYDAILVHYSTDHVFDGTKKDGYLEADMPYAINAYGRSKLFGEQLIQRNACKYYILRTSWLFGPGGNHFVKQILLRAEGKKEIDVVYSEIGVPNYTLDLARATKELLRNAFPFGIYHPVNEGFCSRNFFAEMIFKKMRWSVKVNPVTSDACPLPAKRPSYSRLLNTRLLPLRPWHDALEEYLRLHHQ